MIIAGQTLVAAVADDSSERAQGLMGVEDLGGLDAMYFVFAEPRELNFTMRNTLIPLDIWFVDESGTIFNTLEMEPCTGEPCPQYPSDGEAAAALETPLGRFDFPVGTVVSNRHSP